MTAIKPRIDRPIFIVGMPRSGTTALRDVLITNPAFATTTSLTRKVPVCYPMLRVLRVFHPTPRPVEAGSMWDRFVRSDSDVLTAGDATPQARAYFSRAVENVLRLCNKPRFLSKCPRNGLRIEFLRAIFPDARFIHLLRDGRAVVRSILQKRQQSGSPERWWDVKPEGWRRWQKLAPVEAVAHQWNAVLRATSASGSRLPASEYIEVRYEDFTAAPVSFIKNLAQFCEVEWSESAICAATANIQSRNDKWAREFSAEDIAAIHAIAGEVLTLHGYV